MLLIYAAVAAGIYPNVIDASKNMGSDFEAEYFPEPEKIETYKEHIQSYTVLSSFIENNLIKNRIMSSKYKT